MGRSKKLRDVPSLSETGGRRPLLPILLSASLAALPAALLGIAAWPEIVAPAYALTRGAILYESAYVAYTPGLIALTAIAGKLIGFGAPLFRGLLAISLAASGALLALTLLRGTARRLRLALLFGVALPLLVLWTVYLEGPALWPDAFVAPLLLASALRLERWERRGSLNDLDTSALLLGGAILIKQTAAFPLLLALFWCVFASRRRGPKVAARLLLLASFPYAVFAAAWAGVFRTWSHVRWTLLIPLFVHAPEISVPPSRADLLETVAPYLALVGAGCVALALPRPHLRSPLPALALGVAGMAWPHWGLLHFAPLAPLAALLSARAICGLVLLARRARRRSPGRRPLILGAAGAALLASHAAVALLGGGSHLLGALGGDVRFWDGPVEALVPQVSRRVGRGGSFLNFHAAPDTIYARTSTTPPGGLYVNTSFWFLLNKDRLDERLVEALAERPGTLVLFSEPDSSEATARRTRLYRFLLEETDVVETIDGRTVWRRVRPRAGR